MSDPPGKKSVYPLQARNNLSMTSYLIEAKGLHKEYTMGSNTLCVLKDIHFLVESGEFVAVMGASGSGKSTLLHILGCFDRPDSGTYLLGGNDVFRASDKELSRIRSTQIGFVFQTFNLLPELNVKENVELPFLYAPSAPPDVKGWVAKAIEQVGLQDRMDHRPSELSGGEMQRVAIARALAIAPALVLADEPTGNLDSGTGREILNLFQALHANGATIVLVTHDREVAAHAQRVVILRDGEFVQDMV